MTQALAGAAIGALRPPRPAVSTGGHSQGVISGVSLAIGALGVVMIVSGVHRSPIADVLKAAIKGQPIPQGLWDQSPTLARNPAAPLGPGQDPTTSALITPGVAPGGGTAMGRQVAADAISYVGKVPYSFGGATPDKWDCSGLVTWILHHDFGLELPSNQHTVTGQWMLWSGAVSIPRSQCGAGDLVCWYDHIGIAINDKQMVAAANPKQGTIVDNIWKIPAPVIRRPKAYGQAETSTTVVGV